MTTRTSNKERLKVLIVVGTRPEAIKMAPLLEIFKNEADLFNTKICITAQHREMLDQVLSIFNISPDYDLNIMKAGQDLYSVTTMVMTGLKEVLEEFNPDHVLVHGDTTTSFVASLAAFYKKIPVGHVEAGLRTGDIYSPWPEEANRKLTSQIAQFHFAPTQSSRQNLLREGVQDQQIIVTGNTVIDALLFLVNKIETDQALEKKIAGALKAQIGLEPDNSKFILVTSHRRENFGEGIKNICSALKNIAQTHPELIIVYPVHPNPNILGPVHESLGRCANILLPPPLDYLSFIYLMMHCHLILTDSGGVQEEAPSLGKPVLVMRKKTERPEGVLAGCVKLVGTDPDTITGNVDEILKDKTTYQRMSQAKNPYGSGTAAQAIVAFYKNNR